MALFGFLKRKKSEEVICCAESIDDEAECIEVGNASLSIKILGVGCPKCSQLEKAVLEAINELRLHLVIEHVEKFEKIAAYGVIMTPALVVEEEVVSSCKVLKKDEIVTILKKYLNGNAE